MGNSQLIRIHKTRQILIARSCWILDCTASAAFSSILFHTHIYVCVCMCFGVCVKSAESALALCHINHSTQLRDFWAAWCIDWGLDAKYHWNINSSTGTAALNGCATADWANHSPVGEYLTLCQICLHPWGRTPKTSRNHSLRYLEMSSLILWIQRPALPVWSQDIRCVEKQSVFGGGVTTSNCPFIMVKWGG